MKICNYVIILTFLIIGPCHASFAAGFRVNNITSSEQELQRNQLEYVYSPTIRSVEFYREGWDLSWPVIRINDPVKLMLEFDDLSEETGLYRYTVVHCNARWEPSSIPPEQYLDGFSEGSLRSFSSSRGTLQPYVHYTLSLPNDEIRPILPGNYLLKVYRGYDPDDLIITRRFFIVDPKVNITGKAHRTENVAFFYSHQEIDFIIDHPQLRIDDPALNIRVVVCQNWDWSHALFDLNPTYVNPGQLVYDYEEENLFPGWNEFRYVDLKNLKYQSERIASVRFIPPLQNVTLVADQNLSSASYDFYEDLNGRFLIKWDDAIDSDLDADYMKVHFSLNYEAPLQGGAFYIWGGLTSWGLPDEAQMSWNAVSGAYETDLLLKNGYYNYTYVFLPDGDEIFDRSFTDGQHFETENEYHVFVYFSDLRERYESLVGYASFNSTSR